MYFRFYIKTIRYLYTLVHYLAFPAILVRLLWRSRASKSYRQCWNERFGYIEPLATQASIWVHAVSVGETLAAIPLIKALKERYPEFSIVVTTTTPTGSNLVKKHLDTEVTHVYTPYDVPSCVNRFLRRTKTRICIIMETELWPNMLRCCSKKNIPVMLANARLSERSKQRYKLIPALTRTMLQTYTLVAAQGLLDGERLLELGLNPKRLMISGNIKFDLQLEPDLSTKGLALRQQWQTTQRPTLIAASTHEGEEHTVLNAFKKIRETLPDALLILVPRHPERFERAKQLCEEHDFQIAQRSLNELPSQNVDIYLGDTMGELRLLYAACDVAFVGGSLIAVGGHNPIEPAALGIPILMGPETFNCTEIVNILNKAGALQFVRDDASLADHVLALFTAQELREQMGAHARRAVEKNSGALEKHLQWIEQHFAPQQLLLSSHENRTN